MRMLDGNTVALKQYEDDMDERVRNQEEIDAEIEEYAKDPDWCEVAEELAKPCLRDRLADLLYAVWTSRHEHANHGEFVLKLYEASLRIDWTIREIVWKREKDKT